MSLDPTKSPEAYKADAQALNAKFAQKRKSLAGLELEQQAQQSAPGAHDPATATLPPAPDGISATQRRTGSASIMRSRLKERDAARRDWQCQLTEDESIECAINDPAFFGLSAGPPKLCVGDRICVISFGMKEWAELIVLRADEPLKSVWCGVLHRIDLRDQIANLSKFDFGRCLVERVGNGGWRVMHGHAIAADGFATEAGARAWLRRRAEGEAA